MKEEDDCCHLPLSFRSFFSKRQFQLANVNRPFISITSIISEITFFQVSVTGIKTPLPSLFGRFHT